MYFEWWKNFFSAERYFLITNMALKSAGALWNYTRRRILFSRSLGTHIHTRSADGLRRGHIIYVYSMHADGPLFNDAAPAERTLLGRP
jgi:hypothetical protein